MMFKTTNGGTLYVPVDRFEAAGELNGKMVEINGRYKVMEVWSNESGDFIRASIINIILAYEQERVERHADEQLPSLCS